MCMFIMCIVSFYKYFVYLYASKPLFMKQLFTFLFCIASFSVHAQWSAENFITFDPGDMLYPYLVSIDTINYHHNIWQIGKPNKTVFTSAHSIPNVIVTDTLNPYPVNDTSVFILKMPFTVPVIGYGNAPTVSLQFFYQLSKNLNSIAKLEVSQDSGVHWYNTKDTLPFNFSWGAYIPNLSDTTTGWNTFQINVNTTVFTLLDSFLFRFTFISDSVFANKDGWIIDDIGLIYWVENVPQIQNDNLISIYPNPSKGNIYIHTTKPFTDESSVIIYNTKGQEVYKTEKLPTNGYVNLPLPDGVYTIKYFTKDEYCVKQIVIAR